MSQKEFLEELRTALSGKTECSGCFREYRVLS